MMTNFIARAWQSVKPHVPLIRFRKGGTSGHEGATRASPGVQVQSSAGPPRPGVKAVQTSPLMEDWQLPLKYRRQPLSQQEVEYINRGGPE